ncbi:uncharacterized protein METZ01_LOCUS443715, partial [marine metagenome]
FGHGSPSIDPRGGVSGAHSCQPRHFGL